MFTNPVIARDFPDPDVLRVGSTYYAFATNSGPVNVQVARSFDLVTWTAMPDALPSLPAWARPGWTWAPDVSATSGGFVLYFVARHAASGKQCIGVATATVASGPFRAAAAPLVCPLELGGAIDPASFVDAGGGRYLIWKNDGNCCSIPTRIYAQRISADGLALTAPAVVLLTNDREWEGDVIEAPTIWLQDGRYHLFYSANGYAGGAYSIGHAVGDSITGPFRKDAGPWMQSSQNVIGPGGQDIVRTPDGRTWLAYHTWTSSHAFRELDLGELTWTANGPAITRTRGAQPAP
ncbi:MAG TPA: glycoside hydrolase family 43 protein [Candidatus Limnocylindrales bacterium]|nr:glycoside hydrolase family 43 protein [Candidatus Limnocylindrales bacterium]